MDQRSWGDFYALFRRYCYKTTSADAPEMIYFQLNARSKQLKHSLNYCSFTFMYISGISSSGVNSLVQFYINFGIPK